MIHISAQLPWVWCIMGTEQRSRVGGWSAQFVY